MAHSVNKERNSVPALAFENNLKKEESSIPDSIAHHIPKESPPIPNPDVSLKPPVLAVRRPLVERIERNMVLCPRCPRQFGTPSSLTQHLNYHHPGYERNERCVICGKRFRLREDLLRHRVAHVEENKKYGCDLCSKKYNYKVDLKRHKQQAHTEAPYRCIYCDKGYARVDHWRQHQLNHYIQLMRQATAKMSYESGTM